MGSLDGAQQQPSHPSALADHRSFSPTNNRCLHALESHTSLRFSLVVGFLLSLLGAIVLFFGQLGMFAGEAHPLATLCSSMLISLFTVLFAIGTIVSIVGTGFLIGVRRFIYLLGLVS